MPRAVSRTSIPGRPAEIVVITVTAPQDRRRPQPRGPVVVVTANVHGDECTGTGAVIRLAQALEPLLLRGTVHLYPSLNPEAFERRQRRVPEDEQDLNRLFPGDPEGSPSERLAAAAWGDIASRRPDAVVDLHADAPGAIPYALVDRAVALRGEARATLESLAESYAVATGLTVVREYPDDRYSRFRLDRSLTGAVLNRLRVPAITVEAGPRLVLEEHAVDTATRAVAGVLHCMGLVAEPASRHASHVAGGPWRRESGPRASTSGVLVPRVTPGQLARRGTVVAEVRSLAGALLEELSAETDGFVLSPAERAHVVAGVPACTWVTGERNVGERS